MRFKRPSLSKTPAQIKAALDDGKAKLLKKRRKELDEICRPRVVMHPIYDGPIKVGSSIRRVLTGDIYIVRETMYDLGRNLAKVYYGSVMTYVQLPLDKNKEEWVQC